VGNGCLARLWACWKQVWTYPLLSWVAYPPLLVVFAAVLAPLLGLGNVVGAPSLVWHDEWSTKIWAGFAAAVVCFQLGVVGYLLDSRENPTHDVATFERVARYVRWPLIVLFVCAFVGGLKQCANTPHAVLVLIGPYVLLAINTWLHFGGLREKELIKVVPARHRARLSAFMARWHQRAPERVGASAPDAGAHVAQGLLVFVLVLGYVAVAITSLPAAAAVSVALSLLAAVWGFLRFWFRRFRLAVSVVLIVSACAITHVSDRPITGLSDVRFPHDGPPPRELVQDTAALKKWREQFTSPGNPPLVVVATSGGALRAALWTINVLRDLERLLPGFTQHVRLVTGASGGMVGAAHLISALERKGPPPLTGLTTEWFDEIMADAAKDSLTPVTRALVTLGRDRGEALEESWEEHTNGRLAMPFRTLLPGEREGWLPSLVYVPTMVEDGRRLLISNLDLQSVIETVLTGPVGWRRESISAVQLFSCEGNGIDTIKLSTVARLNATYPWVTSAARLTTVPDRRIVDAGYYDNYGVDIAAAWIRKNAEWLSQNTSGVLLLQIRDETTTKLAVDSEPGPGEAREWFSSLSTPPEAFLSAWSASMSFRNDQKVEVLADNPSLHPRERFFVTETFELQEREPLEWYLDKDAVRDLGAPPLDEVFSGVVDWWRSRPP
jgi:hypothetical protein